MIKQDKIITVFLVILITALIGQIRAVVLQENEYQSSVEAMKKIEAKKEHKADKERINKEYVCFLKIAGTNINYPVMQSAKEQPDYYLTHDALNRDNSCGTPYLCSDCDINRSDNLIIYAHNVYGKLFGQLLDYKSKEFYHANSYIELMTEGEKRIYKIFGVMDINLGKFCYWEMIRASSKKAYYSYIHQVINNSLYVCDETDKEQTQLLTLSTCNNREQNGRFVVVAKQIKHN